MTHRPVCVVGGGAVGLFLAASFAPYTAVTLLVREAAAGALAGSALRVSGARTKAAPPDSVRVITDPAAIVPGAFLFLCTKAFDMVPALLRVRPSIGEHTPVVIWSNGLGLFAEAAAALPGNIPLLRGLSSFGVRRSTPVEVVLAGSVSVVLAGPARQEQYLDELVGLIKLIDGEVCVDGDVHRAEWEKALLNLVVNPLCSLADDVNGRLLADPRLRARATELLREIRLVAAAEGVDLSHRTDADVLRRVELSAANTNSTLTDLRSGRRTEIEYLTGRFLGIAARHGIAVPASSRLYEEMIRLEESRILVRSEGER